jgi:capsular polysaccharide biosynthesis protein
MSLALYKEKLSRLLGQKEATFRTICEKEWTLGPATSTTVPPAIFSEDDLSRVTAVMEDTSLDWEMLRIRGGKREHAPTQAFLISNVELRDGYLSKGRWVYRLLRSRTKSGSAPAVTIPEAAIACTLFGSFYFGHWMTDDLTLHLAASSIATPIVVERPIYHHEPGYRSLFGIDANMLTRARFSRFTMIEDFGQNTYKEERYRILRSRLRAATPNSGANRRIYIKRGAGGVPRPLLNTEEIERYLTAQGFVLIDPSSHSPAEIAQLANGAQIAISVEGSHMVHGLMNLADGGTICQIQPPFRFNNVFKDYTDCLGMRYAFVVGHPSEGGFTLPIDELKRFLDRVESR